jgi:hypothetical protein
VAVLVAAIPAVGAMVLAAIKGSEHTHAFTIPWWFFGGILAVFCAGPSLVAALLAPAPKKPTGLPEARPLRSEEEFSVSENKENAPK